VVATEGEKPAGGRIDCRLVGAAKQPDDPIDWEDSVWLTSVLA
jgi:hypothetical protein